MMETNFIQVYGDVFSSSLCDNLIETYEKLWREKEEQLKKEGFADKIPDPPTKQQVIEFLRIYRNDYILLRNKELTGEVTQENFDREMGPNKKGINKGEYVKRGA